nr:IQ domain-containing protein F2 [Vicugna pacos]
MKDQNSFLAHSGTEAPDKELQAIKIQAWWRGALVRRTLLHAALRACIIQWWWKQKLAELLENKQWAALQQNTWQNWAVVKLQSYVRMWRIRLRYCRLLNAVRIIQKDGHLILIVIEDSEEITAWKMKKQRQLSKKKKALKERIKAATKIQAWWRGTLVRRTLLHAALRAWVIQCWWRMTLDRQLQKKRRAALITYAHAERAVVKLQSLVRMWRVHWRYCQVLNAIYIIQCHWQCHNCQTCALLRGHCVVTATHLQFHIEIINP